MQSYSIIPASRISLSDCAPLEEDNRWLCRQIVNLQNRQGELQTYMYILTGVFGGACLLLLFLILVLFVVYNRIMRRLGKADELQKRGYSVYTGQKTELANPAFSHSPPPPFSAAANNATATPPTHSEIHTAGGIRVLPRNPNPAMLRSTSTNNDKYY